MNVDSINERIINLWNDPNKPDQIVLSPLLYNELKKNCILFVGLNPSFSPKKIKSFLKKDARYEGLSEKNIKNYHQFTNIEKHKNDIIEIQSIAIHELDYFRPFEEIKDYVGMDCVHIDLFYQRETSQKKLENSIKFSKKELKDFAYKQLEITVDIMKSIDPKIIVVINAFARDIIKDHIRSIQLKKYDEVYGIDTLIIAGKPYTTFFSGMLSGQRALDKGSFERLKWHIKYVVDKLQLRSLCIYSL